MPLFHIHGLVAALLGTLISGGSIVCTPGFHSAEFFDWLEAYRPTWFTAVPAVHQSILSRAAAHQEVIAGSRLRLLRSSSAAMPKRLMEELEQTFGVPVVEAYGMTEAAHQITSNPLPPGDRKAGSVGLPAGAQVAIMAENRNELLPTGQLGEVVLRGPNLTPGYAGDPEANSQSFQDGWFRSGDLGVIDPDGYLSLRGRRKEIINRGGEKISPWEVDNVLLQHPAVLQAVAFPVPDPVLGEEVAAAVVLRDPSCTTRELQEFCSLRLSVFKIPRRIVIVASIPRGPTGKIQRISLAQQLDLAGEPSREGGGLVDRASSAPLVPRSDLEKSLLELWSEVLNVNGLGVDQPFLESGGDSLLAARLIGRIRERLRIDISLVDFFNAATIAEQAVVLEKFRSEKGTAA